MANFFDFLFSADFLFYVFSGVAIGSAVTMVTRKSPVAMLGARTMYPSSPQQAPRKCDIFPGTSTIFAGAPPLMEIDISAPSFKKPTRFESGEKKRPSVFSVPGRDRISYESSDRNRTAPLSPPSHASIRPSGEMAMDGAPPKNRMAWSSGMCTEFSVVKAPASPTDEVPRPTKPIVIPRARPTLALRRLVRRPAARSLRRKAAFRNPPTTPPWLRTMAILHGSLPRSRTRRKRPGR